MTSRIACLTVAVACVSASADAALVLSNFQITSSRISFDLAGTVTAQQAGNSQISIIDNAADWYAGGAPLGAFTATDRFLDSYTGPSFSIGSASLYRVDTRRSGSNSVIVMFFNSAFVQGDSVSGTFSFDAPAAGGPLGRPAQQFIDLANRQFKAGINNVAFATNLPAPGAIAALGMTGLLGNRRRRA
jgi:hypothetical protein